MKVICLYVYNETMDIDVYDANFSQTGLLLAEACQWIRKLIIVIFTAYKSPQLILSLYPYISSQDLGLWKTNQSQPTFQK